VGKALENGSIGTRLRNPKDNFARVVEGSGVRGLGPVKGWAVFRRVLIQLPPSRVIIPLPFESASA
jgi:hypothetical protein